MKVLQIILGVILLIGGAGLAVLSHPAFGLWSLDAPIGTVVKY